MIDRPGKLLAGSVKSRKGSDRRDDASHERQRVVYANFPSKISLIAEGVSSWLLASAATAAAVVRLGLNVSLRRLWSLFLGTGNDAGGDNPRSTEEGDDCADDTEGERYEGRRDECGEDGGVAADAAAAAAAADATAATAAVGAAGVDAVAVGAGRGAGTGVSGAGWAAGWAAAMLLLAL